MAQILVVEDELSIADALVFALESDGWQVRWVQLGAQALAAISDPELALIVLDVGLPDMNGFEVCKAIRKQSEVPILFLTARGEEIDRIVGLEIGADDYVVKPFSPREIATRVRVILKRAQRSNSLTPHNALATDSAKPKASGVESALVSEFQLDVERHLLSYLGCLLQLTAQEFKLLAHLVQHPGRVFSRAQLLLAIGAESDAVYERNIDTHIKALRAKLREVDASSDPLQTHRGFGYSYRQAER